MKKIILLLLFILPIYTFGENNCKMDFQLREGLILVEAAVDGRSGIFILDTGAPCLVLNNKYFKGRKSDLQLLSASESIETRERKVKSFLWGCIEKNNFDAISINLTHLERALDTQIFGLIGYDMLRKNEILIDNAAQQIEQYPHRKSLLHEEEEASLVIPFSLSGHLPIMSAEIENVVLHLAFDSAAESNMLDFVYKEELSEELDPKLIIFRGADQKDILVTAVNISSTYIMDETFEDMEYLFKDVQKIRDIGHSKFDGLLGHPFITACGRVSINYRKKEIYVWGKPGSWVNN